MLEPETGLMAVFLASSWDPPTKNYQMTQELQSPSCELLTCALWPAEYDIAWHITPLWEKQRFTQGERQDSSWYGVIKVIGDKYRCAYLQMCIISERSFLCGVHKVEKAGNSTLRRRVTKFIQRSRALTNIPQHTGNSPIRKRKSKRALFIFFYFFLVL